MKLKIAPTPAKKSSMSKASNNKPVNKNKKNVAKAATFSPGRPRTEIKWPRKKKFTVDDVMALNDLSILTIRNRIHEEAEEVGRISREGRGHPAYVYSLSK